MASTIVELSNKNAKTVISNAEFETTFQPILVNNGDTISLKNAFIDTFVQNSSEQIFIPEDIELSMSFVIWEIDNPEIASQDPDRPDANWAFYYKTYIFPFVGGPMNNLPHIMFKFNSPNENDYQIYNPTITFTLENGVYTPSSIATTITRKMSEASLPYVNLPGSYQTFSQPNNPFAYFLAKTTQNPSLTIHFQYLQYCLTSRPGTWYTETPTDAPPTSLGVHNARFFPIFYDEGGNGGYIDYTKGYVYEHRKSPNILGARQISLTYNNEDNGCFEFTYAHSPFLDANNNEEVGFVAVNNLSQIMTNKASTGIMLTDLQPRSFWESLGFNIDKVCLKFDDLDPTRTRRPQLQNFDITKQITTNLFTLDDLFTINGTRGFPILSNPTKSGMMDDIDYYYYWKASNATHGIKASNVYQFSTLSPFILLELHTNMSSTYIDSEEERKYIQAIVSRNYSSNNTITAYSDSGLLYTHRGESIILSNIKVRILDPGTKKELQDITGSNYILLEIIKNS